MNREAIFKEIDEERNYQTERWGDGTDDMVNTPWKWATYIGLYSTRWMDGSFRLRDNTVDAFRKCMIKTAAICVAAVESLDRQRAANGRAFYEHDETSAA